MNSGNGNFINLVKRYYKKLYFRLFLIYKFFYRHLIFSTKIEKKILLIVGNQRSGTSIMEKIFEKDIRTKVYEDMSVLSSEDKVDRIRLNPMRMVKKEFSRVHAPLIVFKPLVESQNTDTILKNLDNSKALWMYRNYKDSIYSNLSHFGKKNGFRNLQPILEYEKNNWRSEGIPPKIRNTVLKHFSPEMDPFDAAALFWYVRNQYYFYLSLDKNSLVFLCKYGYFVNNPEHILRKIYEFIQVKFLAEHIVDEVHTKAVGKGKEIILSAEIDSLCKNLQQRLDSVFKESIIS